MKKLQIEFTATFSCMELADANIAEITQCIQQFGSCDVTDMRVVEQDEA